MKALSQTLHTYLLRARAAALPELYGLERIGVELGDALLPVRGEGDLLDVCWTGEVDAAGSTEELADSG